MTQDKLANQPEFVLKHRLVGAGVLLFFGALILPWLLGAPSVASKSEQVQTENETKLSSKQIENDLLDEIEQTGAEQRDSVYVSKVTPVSKQNQQQAEKKAAETNRQITEQKTATDKSSKVAAQEKLAEKPKTEPKKQPQVEAKAEPRVEQKAEPKKEPVKVAKVESKPTPKVSVGWVVQVGVFSDKKGAARVVSDLKTKGFKPSTTVIDTNQGKATRVWLGPYAQRVDAGKAKTELKKRTGDAGFIRAYP